MRRKKGQRARESEGEDLWRGEPVKDGCWPRKKEERWPGRKRRNAKNQRGGAAAAPFDEGEEGVQLLGFFSFFVLPPPLIAKLPPLLLSFGPIFIGKMLPGPQNWSLNFLSL
jgi:hypothetical protein